MLSMSAEKIKALCPSSDHCQMAAPLACLFPLPRHPPPPPKAGRLPLVQWGPNMCLRKTVHLIHEVNFCNFSYPSQGLLRCVSALWVLFLLLGPIENNELSCHIRMMLPQCCRCGESESCFPSGGDRWAMTHSSAFTCSPLKQRHAFDFRLRVELMAFTRLDGRSWLPLHLPNSPMSQAVHRRFIYYFDSDFGPSSCFFR